MFQTDMKNEILNEIKIFKDSTVPVILDIYNNFAFFNGTARILLHS